jgi:cap1 methyltransferase
LEVRETPDWIPSCELDPPTRNDMNDWMDINQKKTIISDETEFCSEEILHGVLACKVMTPFRLTENKTMPAY